jgi:hypothetical protein
MHEIGHSVMASRHNMAVAVVHIMSAEGNLGASVDETEYRSSREAAECWVLTCLAGYAALAAAGLTEPEAGCDDDFEKAQDALDLWEMGAIEQWKSRAVEIMRQPENLRAVDLLAERLVRDRQMDGQLFAVLLSWADGEIDDEGLAQYEAMASAPADGEVIVSCPGRSARVSHCRRSDWPASGHCHERYRARRC